jgi:hypothetical protein
MRSSERVSSRLMPLAAHGLLGEAAHARHQILARVADVLEHVGHGVAGDHVFDLVAAARRQRHVHGVGVAEEVVQIAQDFLVGAGQEDAQVVFVACHSAGAARARS